MQEIPKLAIGVFCTVMHEKYEAEVEACMDTWVKTANQYNIPVYFFAGYYKSDKFPEIISLESTAEDYQSASTKQFRGLKWLVQNCQAQSYMIFGSDTYPNIPNLLNMLAKHDLSKSLYIGGDGGHRQVGNRIVYFHSGGSGFILTRPAAEKYVPLTEYILDNWPRICSEGGVEYLLPACDVALAYFVPDLDIDIVIELHFHGCNYLGKVKDYQCCKHVIPDKICSCHYMTPQDMKAYHALIV